MAEEKKLKLSYGNFTATGIITVTPDTFQTDVKSKNNEDYIYSRINMKMEDGKGGTFYLNAMDGYDSKKGKTIYTNIKDSDTYEQMQVNFADRFNEEILKHIDDKSFVGVALRKVKNEKDKLVWEYKNFLALYDAIAFIKERFESGMKLRVTGKTRYSTYNGDTQKDFQINNIYLLPEDDESELGFVFRQDVILKENAVDMSEWDEKLIAKINAEVLTKQKKKYSLLSLPLILRATEEKKAINEKMIEKFFKVEEGKVRRIQLEGKYNVGYTAAEVTEEDLPEEAKELIEMGLYTMEEVVGMYANKDKVDEMLVKRPVAFKKKDEKVPKVNMSDDEYKLEDFEDLKIELPWDNEEVSTESSEDDDLSFLDDLD